jgi:hypothetical protein
MLNVGWLAAGHEFPTGGVSREVFDALLILADSQVNIMRGVHDCEFCTKESPVRMTAPNDRGYVSWMGEIHAADGRGHVFVAPSLILHYIREHDYRPPDDFVRAIPGVGRS